MWFPTKATSALGPKDVSSDFENALDRFLSKSDASSNLDIIATGVIESWEFIKSWTQAQSKDPVAVVFIHGIQKQSDLYDAAMDQSIKAAVEGCTFSTDAVRLCDVSLDSDTQPEELVEYGSEMSKIANEAGEAATKARNLFRDISKALRQASQDMDKAAMRSSSYLYPSPMGPGKVFIERWRKFALNVNGFANWWAGIETALNVIQGKAKAGTSQARIKDVKMRWEKVSEDYKAYTTIICAVRD